MRHLSLLWLAFCGMPLSQANDDLHEDLPAVQQPADLMQPEPQR